MGGNLNHSPKYSWNPSGVRLLCDALQICAQQVPSQKHPEGYDGDGSQVFSLVRKLKTIPRGDCSGRAGNLYWYTQFWFPDHSNVRDSSSLSPLFWSESPPKSFTRAEFRVACVPVVVKSKKAAAFDNQREYLACGLVRI